MPAVQETVDQVKAIDVDQYKYGFSTDIEMELAPKGLSEDIVRYISARKNEPAWMLEWRLDAYRRWLTMREPDWARVDYPQIDFQDMYYYAAPKSNPAPNSLDEIDPAILETYKKLGIPLREQEILAGIAPEKRIAVDAVFDSVSVVTTFKEELRKSGVIFCSISEALHEHPELVKQYIGSVVRRRTTSTRRSMPPSSRMARSSTSRRVCAARWSCRPISASTSRRPASSSAR